MDIETSRGSAKFQTANVIVLKQEIDELEAKLKAFMQSDLFTGYME